MCSVYPKVAPSNSIFNVGYLPSPSAKKKEPAPANDTFRAFGEDRADKIRAEVALGRKKIRDEKARQALARAARVGAKGQSAPATPPVKQAPNNIPKPLAQNAGAGPGNGYTMNFFSTP